MRKATGKALTRPSVVVAGLSATSETLQKLTDITNDSFEPLVLKAQVPVVLL